MKAYNRPYCELIGLFMYLVYTKRLNMMYASSCLQRFLSCLNGTHKNEAKRVLYYHLSAKSIQQWYGIMDEEVAGYVDVD